MADITLKKDKDGNQIFQFDKEFLDLFKENPIVLATVLDSLKDKDVKLKKEDVNLKKEDVNLKKEEVFLKKQETLQLGISKIGCLMEILGKEFTDKAESEALKKFEDLKDDRSDEEVKEDIDKNYIFADGEIKVGA